MLLAARMLYLSLAARRAGTNASVKVLLRDFALAQFGLRYFATPPPSSSSSSSSHAQSQSHNGAHDQKRPQQHHSYCDVTIDLEYFPVGSGGGGGSSSSSSTAGSKLLAQALPATLYRLGDTFAVAWFLALPAPVRFRGSPDNEFDETVAAGSSSPAAAAGAMNATTEREYADEWAALLALLLHFDCFRQTAFSPSALHALILRCLQGCTMPPHKGMQRVIDMWLWRCSLKATVPSDANFAAAAEAASIEEGQPLAGIAPALHKLQAVIDTSYSAQKQQQQQQQGSIVVDSSVWADYGQDLALTSNRTTGCTYCVLCSSFLLLS